MAKKMHGIVEFKIDYFIEKRFGILPELEEGIDDIIANFKSGGVILDKIKLKEKDGKVSIDFSGTSPFEKGEGNEQ